MSMAATISSVAWRHRQPIGPSTGSVIDSIAIVGGDGQTTRMRTMRTGDACDSRRRYPWIGRRTCGSDHSPRQGISCRPAEAGDVAASRRSRSCMAEAACGPFVRNACSRELMASAHGTSCRVDHRDAKLAPVFCSTASRSELSGIIAADMRQASRIQNWSQHSFRSATRRASPRCRSKSGSRRIWMRVARRLTRRWPPNAARSKPSTRSGSPSSSRL